MYDQCEIQESANDRSFHTNIDVIQFVYGYAAEYWNLLNKEKYDSKKEKEFFDAIFSEIDVVKYWYDAHLLEKLICLSLSHINNIKELLNKIDTKKNSLNSKNPYSIYTYIRARLKKIPFTREEMLKNPYIYHSNK